MDATLIDRCFVYGHNPTKRLIVQLESAGEVERFAFDPSVALSLIQQLAGMVVNTPPIGLEEVTDAFEPRNIEANVFGLTPALKFEIAGQKVLSTLDLDAARKLHEGLGRVISHLEGRGGTAH